MTPGRQTDRCSQPASRTAGSETPAGQTDRCSHPAPQPLEVPPACPRTTHTRNHTHTHSHSQYTRSLTLSVHLYDAATLCFTCTKVSTGDGPHVCVADSSSPMPAFNLLRTIINQRQTRTRCERTCIVHCDDMWLLLSATSIGFDRHRYNNRYHSHTHELICIHITPPSLRPCPALASAGVASQVHACLRPAAPRVRFHDLPQTRTAQSNYKCN